MSIMITFFKLTWQYSESVRHGASIPTIFLCPLSKYESGKNQIIRVSQKGNK